MVVFLCTSSYDAYGNTCIKFYEHILNGFKVVVQFQSGCNFVLEIASYKVQRGITQKV